MKPSAKPSPAPSDSAASHWLLCGFALMLGSAYFDNLRGPLLPVLRRVFHLTYGQTSWFFVAGYCASVLCTYALIPLSQRYRNQRLALVVCLLGVATGCLAPFAGNYAWLLALAAFIGASVATLGAIGNVLVLESTREANRARMMSGLHTMYGMGSVIGPSLCAYLLARDYSWSSLILLGAPPLFALALLLAAGRRFAGAIVEASDVAPQRPVHWTPRHFFILALFSIYVIGEVVAGSWLVVYLVEGRGLTVAAASPYLSGFFLAMGVSRALCFLFIRAGAERIVVPLTLAASLAGMLLGRAGWLPGFALAGVLGPFYPLVMTEVSRELPQEAQPMALWIANIIQLTLCFSHLSVGYFTDRWGISVTYWLPAICTAAALAGVIYYFQTRPIAGAGGKGYA